MKKHTLLGFFTLAIALLLSLLPMASQAQCVMCKTQVEAARAEKDDYDVTGLNKGILYMMSIPYVLMGAVGYFWYRRTHPKTAKA
ncbi:hypothetical protein Q5H93_19415 [Hymenobacter sp. ASUV-10]|uniref:Uncharacterized protein n=1 Tax=Hymenobacter aranciens TaxID=3063996 RepID=A0ABT9BGU9_9BACT|nr:hypothetical protein [Hymenobacter sp. ASUV-10]MDO7876924.1 hypothetical protein [Hymenobacter sp. ASUV-10]